jgi:peptidoglycan/xylan/chitin deacetylase (PgdA/CDA1 family)
MAELAAWRRHLPLRLSVGLHGAAAAITAVHPAWWPAAAGAVAGNHVLLAAVGAWPRSQSFGETLHRLPGARPCVALTFDDGPDPAVTPQVLDILARFGAQASFFCIGRYARQHPAILRQVLTAGHAVENHTLTHPHFFSCLRTAGLQREVGDAQAILADITGRAPHWFRSPMGFRSPLLAPVLQEIGLSAAAWTRRGYDTQCGTPGTVIQRLLRRVRAGDVLMLHDGHAARMQDGTPVVLSVLPPLLTALARSGLSVVALPAARAEGEAAAGSRTSAGYASM